MGKTDNQKNNVPDQLEDLLSKIDEGIGETLLTEQDNPKQTFTHGNTIQLTAACSLLISDDKTKAWLQYHLPENNQASFFKAVEIVGHLRHHGINYGIKEKNIQKLVSLVRENPEKDMEVIVASGRPAVPEQPPTIEYWIGSEPGYQQQVKLYARKNDLLIQLSQGVSGITGMTVFGEEIVPEIHSGVSIQAGKNVIQTSPGEFHAAVAGEVSLIDHILSVTEESHDGSFSIEVASDEMAVYLSVAPHLGEGKAVTFRDIRKHLAEASICAGIEDRTIIATLEKIDQDGKPVENIRIATGKEPMVGQDEVIEWHIQPQSDSKLYVIDEDGNIDFYNVNKIVSVNKDNRLLTITPPTRGENGYTVYGRTLEGKQGKHLDIHAGDNIDRRNERTEWYAACDGYLFYENNHVSVHPIYRVDGDVDFSTGNITFPGDVIVMKNVLDGFSVQASGSITVKGSVESATLEAGQHIQVQKGIFGKSKGQISARQDVLATFLQNANVKAGRNIIVGNQILNSNVVAKDRIEVKKGKGSIIGGTTIAGQEIHARIIGSDFGTKTKIEVGIDHFILEKMSQTGARIDHLSAQLTSLTNLLDDRMQHPDQTPEKLLKAAFKKKEDLAKIIEKLRHDYATLGKRLYTTSAPVIKILSQIMPGVMIKIRDSKYTFKAPISSCLISYDLEEEKITLKKL
jgi:uncharacterized protein